MPKQRQQRTIGQARKVLKAHGWFFDSAELETRNNPLPKEGKQRRLYHYWTPDNRPATFTTNGLKELADRLEAGTYRAPIPENVFA